MSTEELVQILVPRKHLARIYTFVGSLDGAEPSSGGVTEEAIESAEDDWPCELIERQYRESPESMKKFQRWLADHAGEEFTTTEMAEAVQAKRGWNSIAGMLGAYGNRVKNRYKRTTFPFTSRWNGDG